MKINKKQLLQILILLTLLGALTFAIISALTETNQIQYTCQISDCDIVRQSSYSQIVGIDIAFLGVAYILIIFLPLIYKFLKRESFITNTSLSLISMGVLFGAYLRYVEFFKLHSWCELCISFYICLLLTAIFMFYYKVHFQTKE